MVLVFVSKRYNEIFLEIIRIFAQGIMFFFLNGIPLNNGNF